MLDTQSPAKTILHEGKLYSQKFEQLLRSRGGETLCRPCTWRAATQWKVQRCQPDPVACVRVSHTLHVPAWEPVSLSKHQIYASGCTERP